MTAAFVLGFIAGLVIAALVMWLAVKEIEGIQMSNAPRYRLVGYDIGTAPDENGGWVHWTDHEVIVARLTADLAESRAYALAQFFAGRDAKISKKPERIWARPGYNECWHKRLEEEDVEYVRADLYAAKSAEIARLTAERDAALAGAVKVKPLVWVAHSRGVLTARTAFGTGYSVADSQWNYGPTMVWFHAERGDEAAQAAAQADYEARILASIQPDPEVRQDALAWRSMERAPKDGRMLALLVDYSTGSGPLEDAIIAATIGFNDLENTGDDEWQFCGWNWSHDCFAEGHGEVIGWSDFIVPTPPADLAAKIGGE